MAFNSLPQDVLDNDWLDLEVPSFVWFRLWRGVSKRGYVLSSEGKENADWKRGEKRTRIDRRKGKYAALRACWKDGRNRENAGEMKWLIPVFFLFFIFLFPFLFLFVLPRSIKRDWKSKINCTRELSFFRTEKTSDVNGRVWNTFCSIVRTFSKNERILFFSELEYIFGAFATRLIQLSKCKLDVVDDVHWLSW